MEELGGPDAELHGGTPSAAPTLTEAQAARQRALMRQAAKRGQLAGAPRAAAAPTASAGGESDGSDSSEEDEEEEEEQGGSPARAGGKRPAAKGKAGAEAERERKRCVRHEAPRAVVPRAPPDAARARARMRRLLRNRVSAQLARERKKQHAMAVETRAQELEGKAAALQARVGVLERENSSLRQARAAAAQHLVCPALICPLLLPPGPAHHAWPPASCCAAVCLLICDAQRAAPHGMHALLPPDRTPPFWAHPPAAGVAFAFAFCATTVCRKQRIVCATSCPFCCSSSTSRPPPQPPQQLAAAALAARRLLRAPAPSPLKQSRLRASCAPGAPAAACSPPCTAPCLRAR